MHALILIDNDSSTEHITDATTDLMKAGARVRVISAENLTADDFDTVTCLVLGCALPPLSGAVQDKMQPLPTVPLTDMPRLLWFRTQGARLAM